MPFEATNVTTWTSAEKFVVCDKRGKKDLEKAQKRCDHTNQFQVSAEKSVNGCMQGTQPMESAAKHVTSGESGENVLNPSEESRLIRCKVNVFSLTT